MGNFTEMRDLFRHAGAAIQVEDGKGLRERMAGLLDDPGLADQMGKAGRELVEAHRGATRRTADLVDALL